MITLRKIQFYLQMRVPSWWKFPNISIYLLLAFLCISLFLFSPSRAWLKLSFPGMTAARLPAQLPASTFHSRRRLKPLNTGSPTWAGEGGHTRQPADQDLNQSLKHLTNRLITPPHESKQPTKLARGRPRSCSGNQRSNQSPINMCQIQLATS